ncbi:MAG: hypothetical protein WCK49_07895, partial [Myxococcaceae bacterium]
MNMRNISENIAKLSRQYEEQEPRERPDQLDQSTLSNYDRSSQACYENYANLSLSAKNASRGSLQVSSWSSAGDETKKALENLQTADVPKALKDLKMLDVSMLADEHQERVRHELKYADTQNQGIVRAWCEKGVAELQKYQAAIGRIQSPHPEIQKQLTDMQKAVGDKISKYQKMMAPLSSLPADAKPLKELEKNRLQEVAKRPPEKMNLWKKLWSPENWSEQTKSLLRTGFQVSMLGNKYLTPKVAQKIGENRGLISSEEAAPVLSSKERDLKPHVN